MADSIVNAVTDMWIMFFKIPRVVFYADNGGEYMNVKMDELL